MYINNNINSSTGIQFLLLFSPMEYSDGIKAALGAMFYESVTMNFWIYNYITSRSNFLYSASLRLNSERLLAYTNQSIIQPNNKTRSEILLENYLNKKAKEVLNF